MQDVVEIENNLLLTEDKHYQDNDTAVHTLIENAGNNYSGNMDENEDNSDEYNVVG